MRVFIDTNIIMSEHYLRSTSAQAFLKAAKFLGISVFIPDTVLDETIGNFVTELPQKISDHERTTRDLGKFIEIGQANISLEAETKKYKDWLKNTLDQYDVEILSYPESVSLKEIIEESYNGKKPFKKDKSGHKDYLIWKAILEQINSSPTDPESYFLTNNISDFCEKEGQDIKLHDDLSQQITDKNRPLHIENNLRNFFSEKISPLLEKIDPKNIPNITKNELEERITNILSEELNMYSTYSFKELSFGNDVTIDSIENASITEVKSEKIDADEILIKAAGMVTIEVSGFMDKFSYYSETDSSDKDIYIIDGDWNDHVMCVSQVIETPFEASLSYSQKENQITSHDIALLNEILEDHY